jgi:hypothetical protein
MATTTQQQHHPQQQLHHQEQQLQQHQTRQQHESWRYLNDFFVGFFVDFNVCDGLFDIGKYHIQMGIVRLANHIGMYTCGTYSIVRLIIVKCGVVALGYL